MPLSTLACPPSANYLAKFKANEMDFPRAHPPTFLDDIKNEEEKKEEGGFERSAGPEGTNDLC